MTNENTFVTATPSDSSVSLTPSNKTQKTLRQLIKDSIKYYDSDVCSDVDRQKQQHTARKNIFNEEFQKIFAQHRPLLASYQNAQTLVNSACKNPTNLTNPYWQDIIRYDVSAYNIDKGFSLNLYQDVYPIDYKHNPLYSWQRMGQSSTLLPDGREILIGGEYEDFYDPEFYIYNDVVVKYPDGTIEIYGYPQHIFPATDFHSATLVGNYIWLIGSLGYADKRKFSQTQVVKLNIHTYAIEPVATVNSMGWVHHHKAEYKDGQIIISGGNILHAHNLPMTEQIDTWTLNLKTLIWQNVSNNNWQVFFVKREDYNYLHLWELGNLLNQKEDNSDKFADEFAELTQELRAEPDLEIFQQLYIPPIPHSVDNDTCDYGQTAIIINDVRVRYVAEDLYIMVYIEGELPQKTVHVLQENLKHKLEKLENACCEIIAIEL